MRHLIKYIIGLACLVSMFNCSDLEEIPEGILAPEALFKKESDVEAAVMSGYAILSYEPVFGRILNCALQFRGDMVDIGVLNGKSASRDV